MKMRTYGYGAVSLVRDRLRSIRKRPVGLGSVAVVVALMAGVLAPTPALAAVPQTIFVNVTTDDGPGTCADGSCTLRDAIQDANANAGSTVVIPLGLYVLDGAELDIDTAMTIVGAAGQGSAATVIDADGLSRVFDVRSTGVEISGVTITGGNVNQTGAGVRVGKNAELTLTDSLLAANSARDGGAMFVDGKAFIKRSAFVANTASRKGGAVRVSGSAFVVNSTFTGNVAQSGGAMSVAGISEVSFSTFVDNTSNNSKGGGLDRNGGTVTVTNSILTRSNQGSTDGSDCSGTPDLVGVNIVGNAQGCNPDDGVIIGQALLGPIANYGGPTPAIALLDNSIGVGAAVPCATVDDESIRQDQRGMDRQMPSTGLCDVGAFEINPLQVEFALSSVSPAGFADGEVPVGAQTIPAGNIPSAINATQALFDGSLQASPLNAFPLNSAPLNAFPLNAFPLNAFPLNAFPLNAFFTAAVPLNAFPLNAFPLNAFPLDTILLSDLVILEDPLIPRGPGWEPILVGTQFEGIPLQALTLGQVAADGAVVANLDAAQIDFADLNLQGTPLNAFPLSAFLLGGMPLNAFPLNAFAASGSDADRVAAWCEAFPDFCSDAGIVGEGDTFDTDITLATVALSGTSLASLDLTDAPLNAFFTAAAPLNAFPLNAFPLNAFNWIASPLNAFPLNAFPLNAFGPGADSIIVCSTHPDPACADGTLGDAEFRTGSTFRDLIALMLSDADLRAALELYNVADLLVGLIPPGDVPWEQIDLSISGLQNAADPLEPAFQYVGDVTLTADAETVEIEIVVPSGFAYELGSAQMDGAPIADPVLSLSIAGTCSVSPDVAELDRVVMTFVFTDVIVGQHQLEVSMRAGLTLGLATASGCASGSAGTQADQASDSTTVTVLAGVIDLTDRPSGAQLIQGDVVNLAHIASADDVDLYSFVVSTEQANLGIQAELFLSNLPADYDLALYVQRTDPLRGDPVEVLSYLDDVVLDLNPFDDKIQADTVQDIPQSLPASIANANQFVVKAISSNRDITDEVIDTGTLRAGLYYVQVSSYNGVFSNEAYALRMRTDESLTRGECAAISYNASIPEPLISPSSLASDVNTLFIVNHQLLTETYGSALAANVLAKVEAVAAAAEFGVVGAVINVNGDAAVRAAYQNRFADPCKPLLSNDVVSAIGDVIDTYTEERPGIEYIVLVGDDRQIPMANIVDDANFANERTFSQNFIGNNESISALVAGMYRTDDPYGTSAGIRVRDHELFVPDRSVGRLVETPSEIIASLENFLTYEGRLDPGTGTARTAVQTGYEFLQDGAQLNSDNLTAAGYTVTELFGETWTASDLEAELAIKRVVVGIHAHFDQNNALPAFDNSNGVTDLFSTTDVPAPFDRTIVYSMGCHSGYSDSDVQVGLPESAPDWAQTFTGQNANVFAGNTGFGYGDSDKIALGELLTAYFAEEVGEDGSIGRAWVDAKQRMLADILVLDAYQEKTLMQFVFYGLPMFHVGTAPPNLRTTTLTARGGAAPSIPAEDIEFDPRTELWSTTVSVIPTFDLTATPDGSFYSVDGRTLDVNGRPIQPLAVLDVTADGFSARDALIVGLVSEEDPGAFDPLYFHSATDFGSPRPEFSDGSFPAELAAVNSYLEEGSRRDQLLLAVGQFRGDSTTPDTGTQRRHVAVTAQVYYGPDGSTDIEPPRIVQSRGFVGNDVVFFDVDADDTATRVLVLFRDKAPGSVIWQSVDLDPGPDGTWRGGRPFDGAEAEFFVQVVDDAGNVAMSDSKALNFNTAVPESDAALTLTPSTPPGQSGWYTGPVSVVASSSVANATITYVLDGATSSTPYIDPILIDGDGAHVIFATDSAGSVAILYVAIDGNAPTVTVSADPVLGEYSAGDVVLTISADDGISGSGIVSMSATSGDSVEFDPAGIAGEFMVTVSAHGQTDVGYTVTDEAGNETTSSATVLIDTAAPTVVCDSAPTGWSNTEVQVACTATDADSGLLDRADAAFVLTADIPAGTASDVVSTGIRVVADNVGNAETAGPLGGLDFDGIRIDKVAPAAAITAPIDGAVFELGESVSAVVFMCSDADSDIATCIVDIDGGVVDDGATLDTSSIGDHIVTVTATDNAGNVTSVTVTYSVNYLVCLQYDPTQAKTITSNYTIKIRLCDGDGNNLSSRNIVLTATVVKDPAGRITRILKSEDSGQANSGLEFRFQAKGYVFNLDTSNIPYQQPGTYDLFFTIVGEGFDGMNSARFTLKP